VSLADAKPKKSKGPPPPPPQGWHREEGWKGDCYYPKNYETLGEGDRKISRQEALEAMKSQWSGAREDGVSFDAGKVEDLETVLLGRPTQIESVSRSNLEFCQAVMKGGDTTAWQSWLSGLPAKLTEGECTSPPLTYTVFDYLDIGKSWQRPIGLCQGDKARIVATTKDKYRISDSGAWINVEGNGTRAAGADWPCNLEGCTEGMLVGKFVTDSGIETIFPIGAETTFTAPEHGTISYSINDTVWYDNKFFKSSTIEDRTAITIEPGQ
jgi:hypothetical protein